MSDYTIARRKMVDGQVRPSDVTDRDVLEAMLAIPREAFVPEEQRPIAYLDLDVNVNVSGRPARYVIKPVVIARMLQAAGIRPADNVLVVGCASGYLAALAARLSGRVTATESDAGLADAARANLAKLGQTGAEVIVADALEGAPQRGPFDVILLGGATQIEPSALYRQLAEGGRLVGVFATAQPARATIVTHSQDDYGMRALFDATVPVLTGLERTPAFIF